MKYIDLGLPSGTLWADSNVDCGLINGLEALKFGIHLPTKEHWEELFEICNKVPNPYSITFIGPNNHKIDFPFCGYKESTGQTFEVNKSGYYWSSTYYTKYKNHLYFCLLTKICHGHLYPGNINYRQSIRLINTNQSLGLIF